MDLSVEPCFPADAVVEILEARFVQQGVNLSVTVFWLFQSGASLWMRFTSSRTQAYRSSLVSAM